MKWIDLTLEIMLVILWGTVFAQTKWRSGHDVAGTVAATLLLLGSAWRLAAC